MEKIIIIILAIITLCETAYIIKSYVAKYKNKKTRYYLVTDDGVEEQFRFTKQEARALGSVCEQFNYKYGKQSLTIRPASRRTEIKG